MNLSLDAAIGGMQLVASMGRKGFLNSLGITQHDFDRLTADEPWTAADRNRMGTCLHALMNASGDYMGLPRFTLSAEYVAAAVAVFISGVNVQIACNFVTDARPVEDMARMATVDPVKPDRIFALVQLIYSNTARSTARALFEKNTGLALEKAQFNKEDSKKG